MLLMHAQPSPPLGANTHSAWRAVRPSWRKCGNSVEVVLVSSPRVGPPRQDARCCSGRLAAAMTAEKPHAKRRGPAPAERARRALSVGRPALLQAEPWARAARA